MHCEMEYITFAPDRGEVCGRAVLAECFECSLPLCSNHVCDCDLCGGKFCEFCVTEHACADQVAAA